MPQQIMVVEPRDQLHFKGPYTDVVETELRLKNPTDKQMAFKVKTTAPRQYCVRPNSGFIEAKDERVITVMLQPLAGGQPSAETARHKFLVQTCYVPDGEHESIDTLWKSVPTEELMDSKLRVVFDQTAGGIASPASSNIGSDVHASPADARRFQGASGDKVPVEAELRRALDTIEKLNAEVSSLKKANREYTSASSSSSMRSMGAANEEMQFPMWQVAVVALLAILVGAILSKAVF